MRSAKAPRPHVSADLKISGLNVAELPLGAATCVRPTGPPCRPRRRWRCLPRNLNSQPSEPNSIEDLLERPGPKVKGYTQRAGWSTEPIDIRALGLADVDARVALADVTYGHTRIYGAQVSVGVKDQVAKVTLAELRLYNGSGHGLVTLDGSAAEPAFTADVSRRASRRGPPPPANSAQVDWLAGNADVAWEVSGHGTTEAAMVQSLNGTSNVTVSDGAVIGFDLGGAMHESSEGSIPSFASDPAKKTDFRRLNGTFAIAKRHRHQQRPEARQPAPARLGRRYRRPAAAQP